MLSEADLDGLLNSSIDLQKQLRPYMQVMSPLPNIYDPDFIAENQGERANNVLKGSKKGKCKRLSKISEISNRKRRWTR
jgi:hypothetical protein